MAEDTPDTHFKIIDRRSPETQARVAKMPEKQAAPLTSVIQWVRYDGTEETLPPVSQKVLLRDADSFAKIPMAGYGRRGDRWFFEDDTQKEIEIGDEWAFWPTPPIETEDWIDESGV